MIAVQHATADEVRPLRHAVLRAGLPSESARFDGDDESATFHLAAQDGGAIVGVVSLMARPMSDAANDDPAGPAMQLRGMAVADTHRGTGVGAVLLREACRIARERGVRVIWCNARTPAAGFYLRFGFRQHGDAFDVPTAGPHVRMSLTL